MERVMGALEELKSINAAYGIDTAGISRLQAEMSEARVCTPIIGKFSSGKSALVNTILGYSGKFSKKISHLKQQFQQRLFIQIQRM